MQINGIKISGSAIELLAANLARPFVDWSDLERKVMQL
jgi:hypothetical protein